jgi:tetraacyldisaccharide 4'-kinase
VSRARLEAWLNARWYGGKRPGLLLRGLAVLFGAVSRVRRHAYRRGWLRSVRLPVPVLVVGNIAVGGAGKTPMTIALVQALRARGWRPGVISRGHGGTERGPVRLPDASGSPDPARFGDEPSLIAERTGVPVAIGRRRAEAGGLLVGSGEVDLLIADDGLQHHALARDVEVIMIDGRRRFGNASLLPAGPLREPVARVAESEFRVCNGGVAQPGEVQMSLSLDEPRSMLGATSMPLAAFTTDPVHALAGIADPARFFDALRGAGLDPLEHAFPDHHPFTADDFPFDDGRPVLMTEKDAIKCRAFARSHWYAVPVRCELPQAFYDQVSAVLRDVQAGQGPRHLPTR